MTIEKTNTAGKYPFGSVPVLEVDGVTYAQSVGILRYVGRLGGASHINTALSVPSFLSVHHLVARRPPSSQHPFLPTPTLTHPHTFFPPGLYPELPIEAGLAVDQVVGGVEDLIVATVPFLFAGEAEKVRACGRGSGCWLGLGLGTAAPILSTNPYPR